MAPLTRHIGPSGSATPATGSPSTTSTPASRAPPRRSCSPSPPPPPPRSGSARLGSGAVQLGHRTALSTVEEFGLLDALHPGRFDLGLGRSGGRAEGAIPFPTPDEARAHRWSAADRELVADRTETQFVGSPASVADQLEVLRDATGADELLITTITHEHADRVRGYELLAREWGRR